MTLPQQSTRTPDSVGGERSLDGSIHSLKKRTHIFLMALGIAMVMLALVFSRTASDSPSSPPVDTVTPSATEASIPFVNLGWISDWRPDGNQALYIRSVGGRWYYATLMTHCFGLENTEDIAFVPNPSGHFDKFSEIYVEGQRCPLNSLVESAEPPGGKGNR